ncbi:MAG: putative N-acetylmannosaminyltransferase [Candidatus Ordinivivax streblomastigis]|uniref:Putative N-acetylmannosaminyltransferase n=1 Tax=Candidatus Ordinivivax streblomastigis TaxID=2540710 RepID=A0A5M8P5D5_9BACT|nr:MAG: putative N-acetylmannosaminyltransferase [Candidatus Ordinivivax streblomastigis]
MGNYFNVNLEFNHPHIHDVITGYAGRKEKGYICVVDANVLTMAQKDKEYLEVLNTSTINTCDGGSIAALAGFIHKKSFRALNGPELFSHYIEKLQYKQLLLGSSEKVSGEIKNVLAEKGFDNQHLQVMSLPFLPVEQFDYPAIANEINLIQPDIIWVSLGAPKQEIFMSKILPFLNQGFMFGIGAAFNFYIGKIELPRFKIGAFRFIWLSRLIAEPKKLFSRLIGYILLLPELYLTERRKVRKFE